MKAGLGVGLKEERLRRKQRGVSTVQLLGWGPRWVWPEPLVGYVSKELRQGGWGPERKGPTCQLTFPPLLVNKGRII